MQVNFRVCPTARRLATSRRATSALLQTRFEKLHHASCVKRALLTIKRSVSASTGISFRLDNYLKQHQNVQGKNTLNTLRKLKMKSHATSHLQIALLALFACVAADHAPSYGPPAYKEPAYADVPPQYNYAYAVKDDYSYANFEHNEARDGYNTQGSYRVNLPDGRVQIVTYTADANGYVADVKYEGTAQYPEYKPTYKAAPKPAYNGY